MDFWTRWCDANQSTARTTAKWTLREYRYSNWLLFEIRICWSSFQPHGNKHRKRQYRHHDKTRLFTYIHQNRQMKRFRLPSYTRSSGNTKHIFEASHNKTCRNNQDPRAGPCHNQNIFEKGIGRIQETMAPINTHCNPELQHHLAFQYFQYFQYTRHSISWPSSI